VRVWPGPNMLCEGHMEVYRFMGQFVKDRAVLDVGCGAGYGSHYFMTCGARSVSAIDYSSRALRYARLNYRTPGLEYRRMNAEALAFADGAFEMVTSSENLEHLPHPERNIAEIRRVLKPGGLLALGTPNREIAADNPGPPNRFHLHEFDFEELDALLHRSFSAVHIFETPFAGGAEAQRLREDRRRRGRIGLERHGQPSIQIEHLTVDLTHLSETHSFMALAW